MNINTDSASSFQLPSEVLEICELAEGIVSKELMPLEAQFLTSSDHAFGIKETLNLQAVFGQETLDYLMKIAKDTGLWTLMIPEEFGGAGLSMLSKVAILERFYYTAVPFPFANVPNILYDCKGDQIEKYLNPVMSGAKTTCFAQTEPNAGSDPGGMMQTKAVKDGDDWIINGCRE
jgi:alkylation response protein AidB-like acyl-CoA dehydrogenase